jgi:hypothetical protein
MAKKEQTSLVSRNCGQLRALNIRLDEIRAAQRNLRHLASR